MKTFGGQASSNESSLQFLTTLGCIQLTGVPVSSFTLTSYFFIPRFEVVKTTTHHSALPLRGVWLLLSEPFAFA